MLDGNYKALGGVAVAADPTGHVLVSFAWAPHSTHGTNRIRSFACELDGTQLRKPEPIRSEESTRVQPALTYDESANRFVLAWRDQNFLTSLSTARMAPDERRWSDRARLDTSSNTSPALTAMPSLGETVLWYASE